MRDAVQVMFATLQQWKLVHELPMPGVMLKSCCRWWPGDERSEHPESWFGWAHSWAPIEALISVGGEMTPLIGVKKNFWPFIRAP